VGTYDVFHPLLLEDLSDGTFVLRGSPRVHQRHGGNGDATTDDTPARSGDLFYLQRREFFSCGRDSSGNFFDVRNEGIGLRDLKCKEIAAALVADHQEITQAFRDKECHWIHLAFQQCIGAACRRNA
jgi:hypothetical protein